LANVKPPCSLTASAGEKDKASGGFYFLYAFSSISEQFAIRLSVHLPPTQEIIPLKHVISPEFTSSCLAPSERPP
jgi:hypothetical protein